MSVLLAVLLAGVSVACGPAAPTPTLPAAEPGPTVTVPVDMPVVIALAGQFRGQALATLYELIAAFEAANPDVRVEVDNRGRTADVQRERIAASLAAGDTSVDVYAVDNSWLAGFAANGWLLPLDEYVSKYGVAADGFIPAAIQAGTIDGQLLALPWTVDAGVLYYRADLLGRYGYRPPADWATMQQVALDVKDRAGLPYGLVWPGAADDSLACITLEFVWAYGGDVLDGSGNVVFDSPQTRSALAQMRELVTSGASPGDTATYNDAQSLEAFQYGDAVLLRQWASEWAFLDSADSPLSGQVGVAPLPTSCLTGQSLVMPALSQNPDQAFRLIAFLTGYDAQVQWSAGAGQLPALAAAYGANPTLEALAGARPQPQTAAYPTVAEAIALEVNRMLAGDQDVETTAAAIQRAAEAALGQP